MSERKSHKRYSKEVKVQAVKMFLEKGKSVSAINKKLNIHDRNRVYAWTKQYQERGAAAFEKRQKQKPNKEDPQAYIEQLEMEVELLKKFHAEFRKGTPKKQSTEQSTITGKNIKVTAMCDFFNLSRSAYYAWTTRMQRPDRDDPNMKMIQEAYDHAKGTYGYRRIAIWVRRTYGITINNKAVLRLMRKMGLQAVIRRPKKYIKTTQMQNYHHYPNKINRQFWADMPNQKWVTDVTNVPTKQGPLFLSMIKDLYDGFIVGYYTSRRNNTELVIQSLKRAIQKEKVTDRLILHSDQGHQYCSQAYYVLTKRYNIQPSMSRRGNCLDNAPAENFFSQLKVEAVRLIRPDTIDEANQVIEEYIYFYNYVRIQLKSKMTPYEFRYLS